MRGNFLFLKHDSTGEQTSTHIGELPELLRGLPEDAPDRTVPQEINGLSKAQQELVEFWEKRIGEVRNAYNAGRTENPPKTKSKIVEEKLAEIAQYHPDRVVSRSTWFRKEQAYDRGDIAGLIGVKLSRATDPLAKADPRLIDAIAHVMSHRLNRSTVTEKTLHKMVAQELRLQYRDQAPAMPSPKAMYKYFRLMGVKKYMTGTATNRKSQAGVPDGQQKSTPPLLPGAQIQMDETKLDILVKHGKKILRPSLLMAVDVASRSIVGWTITLGAAKAHDAALVLAEALVPFQLRPDDSAQRQLVQQQHPDWALLPLETHREMHLRKARPVPRRIMTDNGKSFTGNTFKMACNYFGVDVTYSPIHTPSAKAVVERTFGAISEMFLQDKPGYTGNPTVNRGWKIPERDKLLTLALLVELFDDWVVNVWQTRPHKGLFLPLEPTRKLSPNQWFALTSELTGSIPVPLTEKDFIELLPAAHRTIQRTGVQHMNRFFDSPQLDPIRLTRSNLADHDREWEIRFHPHNATVIWLRDRDGNFIECRNRDLDRFESPYGADVQGAAREVDEREEQRRQHAERVGTAMPQPTPIEFPSDPVAEPGADEEIASLAFVGDDVEEYVDAAPRRGGEPVVEELAQ